MRFVLYNHIGSGNHGCEALVRTISELLGRSRCILLSEHPEEEKKYGITDLLKVYPALSEVNKKSPEFLKAYLKLKTTGNYFYMDALPYYKTLDKLRPDDVLVSIGGDIFCYDNYPKYNLIHQYALKHVKKSILLGCSIEPKSLERDLNLVKDLKTFSLITAREHITYQALKRAGIENVLYCPDSAFLLKAEKTKLPDNFIPGATLGINLSPLILKKSGKEELILENIRQVISYTLKNTNQNVALIPHVVWKDNDDRVPLKKLFEEYKSTGRVCLIEDHNAKQLKWIISQCSFLIAARTHASIAAYSTGVPTLVLGYSVKSLGIAEDFFGNYNDYVIPYRIIQRANDVLTYYLKMREKALDISKLLLDKSREYNKYTVSIFRDENM